MKKDESKGNVCELFVVYAWREFKSKWISPSRTRKHYYQSYFIYSRSYSFHYWIGDRIRSAWKILLSFISGISYIFSFIYVLLVHDWSALEEIYIYISVSVLFIHFLSFMSLFMIEASCILFSQEMVQY